MTWHKLCEEFPDNDRPIIVQWNGHYFKDVNWIEHDGEKLLKLTGASGSSFFFDLSIPFTDGSIKWRYKDED